MQHHIKETTGDRVFNAVNLLLMLAIVLVVAYPLYFIIIASVSDPVLVNSGQVLLYPRGVTLEGYRRVLRHADLWLGYRNSIFYTIAGTSVSLLLTIPCAYATAQRDLVGRRFILLLFSITMLFSGGIIPTYLILKSMNIPNTPWAMILPGALSVYNLVVSRTYMQQSIPQELQEAGLIDGASYMRLFRSVVLPLSIPIVAVMALYYGIAKWNDYFNGLIYISKRELVPLQVVLREILIKTDMAATSDGGSIETMAEQARVAELMKYCVILAASLPAMVAYPFVQRHFEKGVMLGAIKG